MSSENVERVFGRGRIKMATGDHVEVFREAAARGEQRRYTKRFLETGDADFRQWTDREWRILARLIGHGVRCVPDVVHYHGDARGSVRQLQTYDAGISVDQWATMLPVLRNGTTLRNVFEDCAHWWALAHHCLAALEEIHALHVVHLDFKADNICIPVGPPLFDPESSGERFHVVFEGLALIDFAFSLVSRERLTTALPIGWEKDYDYQSPRLLGALDAGRTGDLVATQDLDWRCDFYSLAAMLRRYLFDDEKARAEGAQRGWTAKRWSDARSLVYRLRAHHDGELGERRPHRELLELTVAHLLAPDLAESLSAGWMLVRDQELTGATSLVTPMTRVVGIPSSPTRVTWLPTTISVPNPAPVLTATNPIAEATESEAENALPDRGPASLTTASPPTFTISTLTTAPAATFAEPDTAPAVFRKRRSKANARLDPRAKRRSASRVVWVASALISIAAISAFALFDRPELALIDGLQYGIAQLRSYQVSDGTSRLRDATKETTLDARPRPEAERPMTRARTEISDESSEPRATQQTVKVDSTSDAPEANAPSTGEVSDSAQTNMAATDAVSESFVPSGSVEATRGGERNAAASQPRHASSHLSSGTRAPEHKNGAKAQTSRSTVSPNSTRSFAATTPSVTPVPSRRSPPVQIAVTRTSPSAYDPLAARSATAYLTMRATRLEPFAADVSSASQLPTRDPQNVPVPTLASAADASAQKLGAEPSSASIARAPQPAPPAREIFVTPDPIAEVTPRSPGDRPTGPPKATRSNDWRDKLASVLKSLGIRSERRVPIEERNLIAERSTGTRPPAPAETPPRLAQDAPSPATSPMMSPETPNSSAPSRALAGTPIAESRFDGRASRDADLSFRASRMLADSVPRVATQARSDATQVLSIAAGADHPLRQRRLIDATYVSWRSETAYPPASADNSHARAYYDEAARHAFAEGRKNDALGLELRAFAADPRDPDSTGFLALLYLEASPPQPEKARQLALLALAFSGSRRSARFEDWQTFAIASALTGREADAAHAFLTELSLSGDAERTCRGALRAYSTFGEPMRTAVDTLVYRIRSGPDSWACTSPARKILARSP